VNCGGSSVVELLPSKQNVAGSSPVLRSNNHGGCPEQSAFAAGLDARHSVSLRRGP
jgi:hypothetical protein